MLYIRVDGNAEIGTGHVMRCLSIARAAKNAGLDCVFITSDWHMKAVLHESGFQIICLESVWNDLNAEITQIKSLIKKQNVKRILLDSYFATPEYMLSLCETAKVTYIDDLDAFRYPCHMLINYSCYADKFNYPARYPGTVLLLGCRYVPLREEFQNLPSKEIKNKVRSVLVTTGGSDPYNVAARLVKKAKETKGLNRLAFHIVAGRFNAHVSALARLENETDGDGVIVHRNVQNMAELMLDCDIAVSAGGSTLYELCACGTPTVAFSFADNQIDGVTGFESGYMINAGDFRHNEELCLDRMLDGVNSLLYNENLRRKLSQHMQELVDGEGASRIAGQIISL